MKVKVCSVVYATCLFQPSNVAAFAPYSQFSNSSGSRCVNRFSEGTSPCFVPLSILSATPASSSSISTDESSSPSSPSSRRSFFQKGGTAFSAAMTIGTVANLDVLLHGRDSESSCAKCSSCGGLDACSCTNYSSGSGGLCNVNGHRYGPPSAAAASYETQEEAGSGAAQRSPDYYAQMIQMKETNARLEASGYKLDTREEEQLKINDAFASFSYDDATSGKSKSSTKKKGSKKKDETKE